MAKQSRKMKQSRRQKQSRKQRQSRKQQQQQGGARSKTRKVGSWAKAVGAMYRKMKQQNKAVTLGMAMKAASLARKQGKL
jgi:hypothetical protein